MIKNLIKLFFLPLLLVIELLLLIITFLMIAICEVSGFIEKKSEYFAKTILTLSEKLPNHDWYTTKK